jgi:drug/metabolite transporter (DMT)-like permease
MITAAPIEMSMIFRCLTRKLSIFLAILVSFIGVLMLSGARAGPVTLVRRLGTADALYGLASGSLFAVSGICYREASLSLELPDAPLLAALLTLSVTISLQMSMCVVGLGWTDRGALRKLVRHWRMGAGIGAIAIAASIGWFLALTLQAAALVRALGQVEMLFSVLTSVLFFRERLHSRQLIGIGLLVAGLIWLLLGP